MVNRAVSVDGLVAGPRHDMTWIFEHLRDDLFPEVMAATGAMLVGRTTYEVARAAAGGRDVEVLGADLASQCLRSGLVDEVLVYVLPVLLGDGVPFSTPDQGRADLEPLGATSAGDVTMLRFRVRR